MKKLLVITILLMLLISPLSASAAGACTRGNTTGSGSAKITDFPKCISQIYIWSLGVAGVLALLMTTAGGFTYMTAAGNAEKAQKGTEMIWGAVIGLALLFGAYMLLNTINPNLVNFQVASGVCLKLDPTTGQTAQIQAAHEADCDSKGGKWSQVGAYEEPPAPRN